MSDVAWCRNAFRRVDDAHRGYGLYVAHFGRFTDDVRLGWRDTAGADFFYRYLDPHAAAVHAVVSRVQQQLEDIRHVIDRMAECEGFEKELHQQAGVTSGCITAAEEGMLAAHRHIDVALDRESASRSRADEALAVLNSI